MSDKMMVKAVGLALVVIGAGLAYWGWQMSDSLTAQMSRTVTGAMPDAVMYRYIGGAACGVVGLFLMARR